MIPIVEAKKYTEKKPDRCCHDCVQNHAYMCCNYTTKIERAPNFKIYAGYAIVDTYPDPYPDCKYYATIEMIKSFIDSGETL